MSACRCAACSSKPLKSHSEAYRHECEVKWLAALPSKERRKNYLAGVAAQRGVVARERLVAGLVAIANNWRVTI